ncbi:unnamed protein product, partial [Gadus morhua 'NCC']
GAWGPWDAGTTWWSVAPSSCRGAVGSRAAPKGLVMLIILNGCRPPRAPPTLSIRPPPGEQGVR